MLKNETPAKFFTHTIRYFVRQGKKKFQVYYIASQTSLNLARNLRKLAFTTVVSMQQLNGRVYRFVLCRSFSRDCPEGH